MCFQEIPASEGQESVGRAAIGLVCVLALILCAGCLAPRTLNQVVMAYDRSVTEGLMEQMLLNVARAVHREPIHFTAVSNIAATYDLRFSAGATPPLGGLDGGFSLAPIFGASISENPTITIVPIEGEEFTQRLLTPFQEHRLILLLRQGYDIDLMLRLMAHEARIKNGTTHVAYRNLPRMKDEYLVFRRLALQLSTIQDRNALYAEPLMFETSVPLPSASITMTSVTELGSENRLAQDPQTGDYALRQRISGRILITNYDPDNLPMAERRRLHEEALQSPENDVLVDIRAGYPGGESPFHGFFRLRSFHAMINFLGRSLDDEPEFDVAPDPLFGPNEENPPMTLAIRQSLTQPSDVDQAIRYRGAYYYVDPAGPYRRWNAEGFRLLYQLFQMTVSEISRAGIPSLTIAK